MFRKSDFLSVHAEPRWNLLALPFVPPGVESLEEVLAGGTQRAPVAVGGWQWDAQRLTYVLADTPVACRGFWTFREAMAGADAVELDGAETSRPPLVLDVGWNLVGPPLDLSPEELTLPVETHIAALYCWNTERQAYEPLAPGDSLQRGSAYWILIFCEMP